MTLTPRDQLAKKLAAPGTRSMSVTRTLGRALLAEIDKAPASLAEPPSPPDYAPPKVSVGDVFAAPPGTYVVPITLAEPATHSFPVPWHTINRTANEGSAYERASGVVVFHPGETVKHLRVKVLAALAPGQHFGVYLTAYPTHPPALSGLPFVKGEGKIGNDPGLPRSPPAETLRPPVVVRPTAKVFEELFGAGFTANDGGRLADGRPTWQSRLGHGRTQPNNKEIGYYVDPEMHPGAKPFGRDADGFFVQAEHMPGGVKDRGGRVMTYDYGEGSKPFTFTAGMVTTRELFNNIRVGDYVEVRAKLPTARGAWPALWLVGEDWPAAEIDMIEGFFGRGYSVDQVGTTTHWKDGHGGHSSYGAYGPIIRATVPSYDPTRFNTYGCLLERDWITFTLNDTPYMKVPHKPEKRPLHLLVNVAIEGNTPDPSQYPARMHVEFARVWRGSS